MAMWERDDANAGLMRMNRLEQALLGQIKDENIRDFILRDLEVAWFMQGDMFFHYLDEMRPKGNGGAYQFNRHRIDSKKTKILLRMAKKGDEKFRPVDDNQMIVLIEAINARWKKRDEDVKSRNVTNFTVIQNISSDRQVRIRDNTKIRYKKNGDIDERMAKGLLAKLHDVEVLTEFLYQLNVPPPEPTQNYTLQKMRENLRKTNNDITGWSNDKVEYFHRWLKVENTHGIRDKILMTLLKFVEENNLLIKK